MKWQTPDMVLCDTFFYELLATELKESVNREIAVAKKDVMYMYVNEDGEKKCVLSLKNAFVRTIAP